MSLHESITVAIYRALDEINGQLPSKDRLQKESDTVLFGRESGLDSLGLVNLIVAVERQVERETGRPVSLSSPDLLLGPENPFATVRALSDHVVAALEKA